MDIFKLGEKKRPDMLNNKEAWNASWEKDLKKTYKDLPKILPHINLVSTDYSDQIQYMTPEFQRQLIELHNTQKAHESTDELYLDLQGDIRVSLLRSLAVEELAEKWTALTLESRREYILEAIFRTCSLKSSFESYRTFCPDITVSGLADNPQTLLDLINTFANTDDSDMAYFPHRLVDMLFARIAEVETKVKKRDPKSAINMRRERSQFIVMLLQRIEFLIYDVEDTPSQMVDRTANVKGKPKITQLMRSLDPDKDVVKKMKKDLKQIWGNKDHQPRCWGCGIYASQLPESTVLQACAKCKKINRSVLYCSRECQKDDWKNGTDGFAPHKESCGNVDVPANLRAPRSEEEKKVFHVEPLSEVIKRMSMNDGPQASSAAAPSHAVVPQSNKPFKKSAALLYQQSMLVKTNADYVLCQEPIVLRVRMPVEAPFKVEFAAARERAMETGDPVAVGKMYDILKSMVEQNAPMEYDLAKQFRAEYGVILPECRGRMLTLQQHIDALNKV